MDPIAGPSSRPFTGPYRRSQDHAQEQQQYEYAAAGIGRSRGVDAPYQRDASKDMNSDEVDDEDDYDHEDGLEGTDSPASDGWRRFDEFSTIDWVQDSLGERARRRSQITAASASTSAIYSWISVLAHAAQSWFVIALVGAAIGVNAALISIITSWLSDIKQGHCSAGWWLNKKLCCLEMESADGIVDGGASEFGCHDWHQWSSWTLPAWLVYVLFALVFSTSAAYLVKIFAPAAAGSGISEIKCMLSGFALQGYLSASVLSIKSITLPLAIASGLSVGKEGPSVHMACCIGNVVAGWFDRFRRSRGRMREIVTASSAAGVAVAFGSPIGGVLFALEEMTITFPIKTMWRAFFCALVATVTLAAMNPFRTGKLVLFQVSYDRDWHFFELGFFILLGVFGGLYGAFVIKYNFQVQSFRRKHLAAWGIQEAVFLAGLTACIGYFNKFLRIDMTESLEILFRECEKGGDYDDLCQTWAQWRMINSLLLATVLRIGFVILSYGCKVPAGIFVPSMAVGATFGRMVGILVKAAYRAYPEAALFAACDPEKPCITPGTYAFLGAAAALAGIMRITVTVVVIMFELTGALTYILPTMIVVMVTKAVSEFFDKGGIADQAIRFNGLPSLEKEDLSFNAPVGSIMKKEVTVLTATSTTVADLERRLSSTVYRGFPVVKSLQDPTLLGFTNRDDIMSGMQQIAQRQLLAKNMMCTFTRPTVPLEDVEQGQSPQDSSLVDLSHWVNDSPLAVSPRQPIDIVHQMFKAMGPRCVLVEEQGQLVGLLTLKDLLRHVIAAEHEEEVREEHGQSHMHELEGALEEARLWLRRVLGNRGWLGFAGSGTRGSRSRAIRLSQSSMSSTVVYDAEEDEEGPPQNRR